MDLQRLISSERRLISQAIKEPLYKVTQSIQKTEGDAMIDTHYYAAQYAQEQQIEICAHTGKSIFEEKSTDKIDTLHAYVRFLSTSSSSRKVYVAPSVRSRTSLENLLPCGSENPGLYQTQASGEPGTRRQAAPSGPLKTPNKPCTRSYLAKTERVCARII